MPINWKTWENSLNDSLPKLTQVEVESEEPYVHIEETIIGN